MLSCCAAFSTLFQRLVERGLWRLDILQAKDLVHLYFNILSGASMTPTKIRGRGGGGLGGHGGLRQQQGISV